MPIHNNPHLYTGGSERFNSQPYVNFYAHLMARKRAKEDALDNYYQNLNKGINPAGTRTQDIPQFMEKVKGFREYYAANRDRIKDPRKDDGRAQTEYQTMYQDALNFVQSSKFEEEKKKPLIEILTDPAKRDRVPEKVLFDLHDHDLPLNHPNRKSFDISQLSFDPKPFNQTEYIKSFSDLKMSETTPAVVKNKDLTETITTVSILDDAAKKTIYARAGGKYSTDTSFKDLVDNELSRPENFEKMNEIFKTNYGEAIETPEDLAAAYTLSSLQPSMTKVERKPDTFASQKAMEAIRHANDKDLLYLRESISDDKDLNNLWVEKYTGQLLEKAKDAPLGQFKTKQGEESWESDIPVDPVLSKAFQKNGVSPIFIRVTNDGKFRVLYPEVYSDTKQPVLQNGAVKITETLNLDRDQFETSLGKTAGVKQYNIEQTAQVNDGKVNSPSSKKQTTTIKIKTYKGLDKYGNPIFE